MAENNTQKIQKPNFFKNFDGWNEYKKELEIKKSPLFDKQRKNYRFRAGEIWYCSIGVNIGTEICGKNEHFERPILAIRKSGRHFVALPLTSEKPNNPAFYYDISYTFDQQKGVNIPFLGYKNLTYPSNYTINSPAIYSYDQSSFLGVASPILSVLYSLHRQYDWLCLEYLDLENLGR